MTILDKKMILEKVVKWMLQRDWKHKIAKKRQFEQSLFEHTLVEVDAALQLLPILRQPHHLNLSEEEEKVLIISLVAHDVGKERRDWQEYIQGKRGFLSDVAPELTQSVLPELCTALDCCGVGEKVISVIENCINLHMSRERHDANVIMAMLKGTDRWYTLANIVYYIDNICSAKGVLEAKSALEKSVLGKHLKTSYHQLIIRGVSTTALHRAALESFQEEGWTPLLHFSDATLYVCSAAQHLSQPSREQIKTKIAQILKEATGKDVTEFIVGSPTGNILPKPELFEYSEMRTYLQAATRKAGRKKFLTDYEKEKKHVANGKSITIGRGKSKAEVIKDYWALKGISGTGYSAKMDQDANRISFAHPDMIAFKFFKAAMKLIGGKQLDIAQKEYEAIFGSQSWSDLFSTSTLMPAQDMDKTVDRFWQLPGKLFGLEVSTIEEMAPEKRTELLVNVLAEIAQKVFTKVTSPPTRAILAQEMASGFINDLVSPIDLDEQVNLMELARYQMEFYATSKPFTGKQVKKGHYICPICNLPFQGGKKAAADFIDKPESYTNRGVAHESFGYVTICDTCYHERILRQLLLGQRASELIIIFPRMNIAPGTGELLMRKIQALYDKAYTLMVGDNNEPDQRLWLAFTPLIATKMIDNDIYRLTPGQLVDLLSYRTDEKKRGQNKRELEKALKKSYDNDLEMANTEWNTDFASWDDAVEAVYANEVIDPTARQIRAEVYRLYPQMRLICQTPHMIMLPLTYSIRFDDDSDTNAALRNIQIALLLGLNLDVSVAIIRDVDRIDFQGGEGVAFISPVPAVRSLIGSNWVPLAQADLWLRRICISSILADVGDYSKRSGIFEVLTAPTVGHILRRIEQKRAKDKKSLTYQDIKYLKVFEEVMEEER